MFYRVWQKKELLKALPDNAKKFSIKEKVSIFAGQKIN